MLILVCNPSHVYFHFDLGQCLFTQRSEFMITEFQITEEAILDTPHITANWKPLTPSMCGGGGGCSVPIRLKEHTQWLTKRKTSGKITHHFVFARGISCFTAFSFLFFLLRKTSPELTPARGPAPAFSFLEGHTYITRRRDEIDAT